MTAALERGLPRVPIVKAAFLLGSVAPDLPLWLLSLGGAAYYHLILGWSPAKTADFMFSYLYFHHPFWLVSHNFLHAPLILLLGIALVWQKRRNIGSPARWLYWFLLACLFHSIVDIFTHTDDGPLLFFPIDWHYRFPSPVSYWDPRYHGRIFARFELSLDGILLIYLLTRSVYKRLRRQPPTP